MPGFLNLEKREQYDLLRQVIDQEQYYTKSKLSPSFVIHQK